MQSASKLRQIPGSWLVTIFLVCGLLGWSLAVYRSPTTLFWWLTAIACAVIGSKIFAQCEPEIWAGICTLTFSIVFIWVGVFESMGAYHWSLLLVTLWAIIFPLETAWMRANAAIATMGFNPAQSLLLLTGLATIGITTGWMLHEMADGMYSNIRVVFRVGAPAVRVLQP